MKIGSRTILFVITFLLPLLAVVLYEVRYATDRYHSEASITITQDNNSVQSLDLSVIGLPSIASSRDALVLSQFIQSVDMLLYLEDKLKLRDHYSNSQVDWYSRLASEASLEDFHEYMTSYLTVEYDVESQVIFVHVQSFGREYSQKLVEAVLERSQVFVDNLNAKVTIEQTKFFERQLEIAEMRMKEVKNELLKFQRENRILTTEAEATMINANIAALETIQLQKQAELNIKLKELNETSPAIQVLRLEMETVQKQIAQEKERLSGSNAEAVSELDAKFRDIQLNLEFVTTIYKSNLAQLERARLEAVQRLKYLIVVTQPSLADASLYPDRTFIIGTTIIVLLMIYFILSLIVAIIREHS
jgi:capsular polysaccharide transport system permease protein